MKTEEEIKEQISSYNDLVNFYRKKHINHEITSDEMIDAIYQIDAKIDALHWVLGDYTV